jgi:hypothetical protein
MAEIKSAIELAMERTRNLVMDDDEKKESQKKDVENRIRAVLRRYLEGMTEMNKAMGELEEVKAEPELKRKLLVTLLIEDFDITRENSRVLDLFHHVGGGLSGPFVAELDEIRKEFSLEMEKRESMVRSKIENRLHEMDITGDGLDLNVEAWEEWSAARAEAGRIFGKRIDEWKERLVKALDKG